MKLKFSKSAVKFLEKLNTKDVDRIREQLASLLHFIKKQDVIPFTELDINLAVTDFTQWAQSKTP